jgi:uncharacterized membrane protein
MIFTTAPQALRARSTKTTSVATACAVGAILNSVGKTLNVAGAAVGAVTGTVAGAVRDFRVAGVGLDFVEEAERLLKPGKVGLVAEFEEAWIITVDVAFEFASGQIFRRTRSEMAEALF